MHRSVVNTPVQCVVQCPANAVPRAVLSAAMVGASVGRHCPRCVVCDHVMSTRQYNIPYAHTPLS